MPLDFAASSTIYLPSQKLHGISGPDSDLTLRMSIH
jgi:hypothetical protein